MSIIDDIKAEKAAAVAILDELIIDAQDHKNDAISESEKQRWAEVRDRLEEKREKLDVQAFERTLAEAQPALDALKELTGQLQTTAGHMQSATQFVDALNGALATVDQAIGTLKV